MNSSPRWSPTAKTTSAFPPASLSSASSTKEPLQEALSAQRRDILPKLTVWNLFGVIGQSFSLLQDCQSESLGPAAQAKPELTITQLNRIGYKVVSR